jgi:tetratricopeptide (TPR) repeat protein
LAADPNCADNRYYLANSLQQVGDIQQARGQQAAALDTCREGLEICKQLLSIDSNRPVWLEARAFFLGRLGQIHAARGLRTSATALFQEGLEIARRMVTLEPNRTDFLYALSVSLTQVGDALAEQGERDAALALLQESIELNRRLVTAAPEKLKSLRALNISLNKVGGVLAARGERDAALVSFQEGLDVARRLVTANPHNLDRLRDLAISLGNVANVHQVAGRMDLAFALSQENIDIFRRLLAAHPDRPDCLRDLGVTLSASGRIQKANGQMDGALSSFQQGLEICRRLHSTAPQHPERLRDLMILLVDVGDIHEALGLMGPALAYFEEGLETSKRLLATDPDEPQWMYEVLNMLAIIARVVERVGKTSEAADYWFEANEILSSLPRETRLLPWWRPFYQQTQQNLLRLSTIAGAGNVSATNSTPVGNRAADTRYEYELTAWKALPFWRRLVKKRPKPPEKPGLSLSQSQIDESTAPIVADLATIGMLLGTSAADLRILHDLISPDPGDVPGPHAEQSALRGGQTDRQHSQPRQSLTATDPEASPSPPPGRVSGSSAGSSSNEAHGAAGALVRTDGVYHCQHADYSSYVRFLADGFALTVSSSGTPHQVARWLTLDHDQVSRGRYSVDGTRVTFSSTSSNGTVHYEGEFTITGVDLRSVSRINGHHGTETYVFVPVPKPFE